MYNLKKSYDRLNENIHLEINKRECMQGYFSINHPLNYKKEDWS